MLTYVLLDTGFQMPFRGDYFVAKDITKHKSLLDRNIVTEVDINKIQVSDQIYALTDPSDIINFLHTANFKNLKYVLELVGEIFTDVSISEFYTVQLLNRYLTPSNYRVLISLINNIEEFRMFNYAAKFTRFNDKPLVASDCEKRLRDSKEIIKKAATSYNDKMTRLLAAVTLGDLLQFVRITLLPPN